MTAQLRPRLAAALAILALLLTGCNGTGTASGSPTVTLLVFGAPEELAAYRTLVAAYEQSAPGAHVQLIEASNRTDLITKLSTSTAGGAPPDVFLMNYRFYAQFAARDAIEPLDERLRGSDLVDPADYYPVAMQAFRWRGQQLCLPQNVSSLAVYYNRELFQRFGVEEPQPGWSWTDMVTTAGALTRDANGAIVRGGELEGGAARVAIYGLGVEPSIIRLAPFAWSNGGEIVDDPAHPTRIALDSLATKQVLRNLVDLRLAYGVVPTDEEVEAEDDESRFANGRLAMLLSSRRSTTTLRTIKGLTWDVAPLPRYERAAGVLHSDAYCMTRGSPNKDGAWRFMEFAIGAAGQRILAGTGRIVPSNIDVSQSLAFLDPAAAPRHAQVFLDAIPTVRPLPVISTWPEIEDVTNGILENAFYRGDRIDEVLRELDQQTRPLFARGLTE